MHAFTILAFASGTLAIPSFGLGSFFGSKRTDGSSAIPPAYIRDQFPQFNESQWEKYHCFSYADLLEIVPPCADYCEQYTIGELTPGGFGRDGCHQDDFPCHCARSQVISDLIEPCIFPFINASATCALKDLGVVQVFVTDSCNFFNATQYADYNGCSKTIKKAIASDIKAGTAPTPSVKAQAFKWR